MLYKVLEQLKNLKIWVHPFAKEMLYCQYIENQYTGKDQGFFSGTLTIVNRTVCSVSLSYCGAGLEITVFL